MFAYPSTVPSLNTLIVYSTTFLYATSIGSFVCVYFAVVSSPLTNFEVSTTGSLEFSPSRVFPFTFVINLRKLKSNSSTTSFSKSSSSSCPGTYGLSISFCLYDGKSLSVGISAVFLESLSTTSGLFSPSYLVISAIFVINCFATAFGFTLHFT